MIRVLHVFHEMANGGIEHFVMDYYRHIDRSEIQFDFLVSVENEGYFAEEIRSMGGRIYRAFPFRKNPIKNFFDIAKIVRENKYQIVHRHTGSAFGYFDLWAARIGGAKRLILHAHNNQAGNKVVHELSKAFLTMKCERLACSQEAGEWLFGRNSSFTVISNAIDCKKFKFSSEERARVRHMLGIENKYVIGHVGRFELQKNHMRILEIFSIIKKMNPESVLVCIGKGSLFEETAAKAKALGVDKDVCFLGARSDIAELMKAFDVFLLPSLYEGFPFVLVEAQASGLPCVVSNRVPKECDISGHVQFVDLSEPDDKWADMVLQEGAEISNRTECSEIIRAAGYDIQENAERLSSYYKRQIY